MKHLTKGHWAVLAFIFMYSFIPSVVGLLRIPELLGAPMIVPPNPRAVVAPAPIILHILASSTFCLVGAVQFLPRLRQHRPALHRAMGRVVATAGCISAMTGLWMTVVYVFPPALQGPLLYWVRIALSVSMALFILCAVSAARQRRIPAHRASMLRAYAIGQGASTQTLLFLTIMAVTNTEPLGLLRDVVMVTAWVINLAVAELLIRMPRLARASPAKPPSAPHPVATTPLSDAPERL